MRLRKLALAVGATAALCSNLALALGLGEITLNSSLNQPLDARIKLLQVRDLSEQEIIVKLASREAFESANVERLFFLSGIKFEVVLDDPSDPYIHLTTRENVREPYLNFLIETQWPTGRMLREYTVLMDLPTFSERNQRTVTAPAESPAESAAAAPQVKPRPTVKPAQPAPSARPARAVSTGEAGTYAVNSGDTLWEIALQARPDRSYSVQQTMLAIQRLNPDAFINGNINLLRKGQILRLPAADEIASLSTRQAINEVAYQNSQWGGAATLEASRRSGRVTDGAGGREGRVNLSAGNASEQANTGRGSGRVAALENDLAIAQEQLDGAQRENEELRARVQDLEKQIDTMTRLIEVSNEEMKAVQQAMAKGEPMPASQTSDTAAPDTTGADSTGADAAATTPESKPKPEVKPKPAATTVVRQQTVEPGLVDMLMANILYIGIALVALLGGFLFWRRKQAQDAQEQEAFDAFLEEDESDSEQDDFDLAQEPEFDEVPEADEAPEETFEELETAEAETADVAGEADIYIAYGKYDQAEDMLKKALDREPGRLDITLKLLEVYAETQNLEAFDQHFAQVLDSGDEAAIARAQELRESIPGAGEFDRTQVQVPAAAAATAAVAEASDDEDSLMDLTDGGDEVDPLLSLAEEGAADEEFAALQGLDELDGDLASEELSADEDFGDLDFNLDGLDEEPAAGDGDLSEEFSLDLDAGEDNGDTEAFSLDLDEADSDDTEAFSLDLDEADSDDTEAFSLDLDDAGSDSAEDFSLDLDDGSSDALAADESFSLDLDDDSAQKPESADGSVAMEEDFALDLEQDTTTEPLDLGDEDLSLDLGDLDDAESADVESAVLSEGESVAGDEFEISLDDADDQPGDELAAETLTVDADDFESQADLDDLDLETLDREMASLSADMDLDADLESLDSEIETEPTPVESTDEVEEFDLSADLGIEEGADELPPLTDEQTMDAPETALDDDAELGFLADSDEVATKLDLARAYIDMGDSEGARDILSEVLEEGDDKQKGEAQELMGRIS